MINKIYENIEQNRENMVKMLAEWISIPSVVAEKEGEDAPFGRPCAEMMKKAERSAAELGFNLCKNYDNHVLTIDLKDEKAKLGVACHLDVVDANKAEWDSDPWTAVVTDTKIYGRGASDNKSAGVAALFALNAIKNAKIDGNVRIYMGSAEEVGSPCFNYYQEKYEKRSDLPKMIVPDTGDTLVHGEWGILRADISAEIKQTDDTKLIKILCGEAHNIIPATASAEIRGIEKEVFDSLKNKYDFEYTKEGEKYIIKTVGKSCHSSVPQDGVNAAVKLLDVLTELPIDEDSKRVLSHIKKLYCASPEYIAENTKKDLMTFSLTGLFLENGKLLAWHDSRYSYDISSEILRSEMREQLKEEGISVEFPTVKEPHFVEKNSSFITKLSNIYEEFAGKKPNIKEIRAATYASQTEEGVAYGQFDGRNIHSINENISIEDLVKTTKLLAFTMYKFLTE